MQKKMKSSIFIIIIAIVVVAIIVATVVIFQNGDDSSSDKNSSTAPSESSTDLTVLDTESNTQTIETQSKVKFERYDNGAFNEVKSEKLLFKDVPWEPGYAETTYFKVSNISEDYVGALFNVMFDSETVGTNVLDGNLKYSNCLQAMLIDIPKEEVGNFDLNDINKNIDNFVGLKSIGGKFRELEKSQEIYYALVVYMPGTVGNEVNVKQGTEAPQFTLNISVTVR